MKNIRVGLILGLILLFGLGAADGISQLRGIPFLPAFLENTLTVLFFLGIGGLIWVAWREKNRDAMARIRVWSLTVLLLSLGMLFVLWGLTAARASAGVVNLAIYALAVISVPMANCTVMFWPVLGWSLTFVVSLYLTKKLPKEIRRS
ncbi:MAG: hypothetical protein ACI3V3_04835 [Faecousia sp.]